MEAATAVSNGRRIDSPRFFIVRACRSREAKTSVLNVIGIIVDGAIPTAELIGIPVLVGNYFL